MSVTVSVFPTQTPPKGRVHQQTDSLIASMTIVPDVDMLFSGDRATAATYLREWAANLVTLADDLDARQAES